MSQKYVVVHFLDKQKDGYNFAASSWPLHITLLPLVTLGYPLQQFIDGVESIALQNTAFEVITSHKEMFGVNRDVPVTLLETNTSIKNLHQALVYLCLETDSAFDEPGFTAQGYLPHITTTADLEPAYTINSLSIIDMYPDNDIERREIVQTFKLK